MDVFDPDHELLLRVRKLVLLKEGLIAESKQGRVLLDVKMLHHRLVEKGAVSFVVEDLLQVIVRSAAFFVEGLVEFGLALAEEPFAHHAVREAFSRAPTEHDE